MKFKRITAIAILLITVMSNTISYAMEEDTTQAIHTYKSTLSPKERLVYNQLYKEASNFNTEPIQITSAYIYPDELKDVVGAIECDHPELYHFVTAYSYSESPKGYIDTITFNYCLTKQLYDNFNANYNRSLNEIVTQANTYSTSEEKILWIHDQLCDMNRYDNTNQTVSQSAYSSLCLGSTVCNGTAKAFKIICNNLGIECVIVRGYSVAAHSKTAHAMNLVYIDNVPYIVDITNDDYDSADMCMHTFCLISLDEYKDMLDTLNTKFEADKLSQEFFNN